MVQIDSSAVRPAVTTVVALATFCIFCIMLFRPLSNRIIFDRMPFLLSSISFLLFVGVGELPFAFPRAFEVLLGHSVYQFDPIANGTWIENYWIKYFLIVWVLLILIAVPWSIVNLFRRRSIKLNILALLSCAAWGFLFFLGVTGHFLWYL